MQTKRRPLACLLYTLKGREARAYLGGGGGISSDGTCLITNKPRTGVLVLLLPPPTFAGIQLWHQDWLGRECPRCDVIRRKVDKRALPFLKTSFNTFVGKTVASVNRSENQILREV